MPFVIHDIDAQYYLLANLHLLFHWLVLGVLGYPLVSNAHLDLDPLV